jgi:hypothetical protein
VSQLIDQFAFNFSASPNMVGSASASQCKPPSWTGVPFPTAGYDQNLFYLAVGYLLGLVLTMATLYPVSRLIKDLVQEKETKMRETAAAMVRKLQLQLLEYDNIYSCIHHVGIFLLPFTSNFYQCTFNNLFPRFLLTLCLFSLSLSRPSFSH